MIPVDPRQVLPRLDATEAAYLGEDLRQIRDLVHKGDNLAISGGPNLAWWGLVLAIGSLCQSAQDLGYLTNAVPFDVLELLFGFVGSAVLRRVFAVHSHFLKTWRTEAISTVWLFAILGIFIFQFGLHFAGLADSRTSIGFLGIVYSLVIAVTAVTARMSSLFLAAGGWVALALVIFLIHDDAVRRGLLALTSLACMFAPGLALSLKEKRSQLARTPA